MREDGRERVVIEGVKPQIDCGTFAIKRVSGESVDVEADIFSDGHDAIAAALLFKRAGEQDWREEQMHFMGNDRWKGSFIVGEPGIYHYTIEGWVDRFKTWQRDIRKKRDAGQDLQLDMRIGARLVREAAERTGNDDGEKLLTYANELESAEIIDAREMLSELMHRYQERFFAARYAKELTVIVDRPRALFSAWYEMFPRSCPSAAGAYGSFRECESLLPRIARMGFDILYLPPIHPIGKRHRKGRNNTPIAVPDDVGSPWAIGSGEGGHKSVNPGLGAMDEFTGFMEKAKGYGIEIAMDLAFQCSPDHPYVQEHPEWFSWRPNGTIQYAENPPKKYEDIVPLNFETSHWRELWDELKSVVAFWIEKGVRIFRVDNPHTKPFPFWQWLIGEIKKEYPEVIFLSEAFTRPKVMYRLAKIGFTQSYTYFTWRNTKAELLHYIRELTETEVREYFRPNFWPNTPDILPEYLQYGGRSAFMMRLVLASTLSSNYGIYGPAFELMISAAQPGSEEYLDSEKYEVKSWNRDSEGNLADFIARINRIRKENSALQSFSNIMICEVENDKILCYCKFTADLSNLIVVALNLDPFHSHSGSVTLPLRELGIDSFQPYLVHDLLGDDKFIWQGARNYIEINPSISPAYIFRIRRKMKREYDFDYFM